MDSLLIAFHKGCLVNFIIGIKARAGFDWLLAVIVLGRDKRALGRAGW